MNGFVGGLCEWNTYDYDPANGNAYKVFLNEADLTKPGPAMTWVFVDEHPDSINDGLFGMKMCARTAWPNYSVWDDTPASYHNGACGFGFADGHAEVHKWLDSQTKAPIQGAARPNPWAGVSGQNGTGTTSPRDNGWMDARTSAPY